MQNLLSIFYMTGTTSISNRKQHQVPIMQGDSGAENINSSKQ
jgi:hypothetical protein